MAKVINYGKFNQYYPDLENSDLRKGKGIVFTRNEQNIDLYDLQATEFKKNELLVDVLPNSLVFAASNDKSGIFPTNGRTLYGVRGENLPLPEAVLGLKFNAALGTFSAPEAAKSDYRQEAARRITHNVSDATQLNLTSYMTILALKSALSTQEQADVAAYIMTIDWISAMRARWRELFAASEPDFKNDAQWPIFPTAAAQLVARF